ncbi:hypothetical protein CB1_105675002 [Camelus ferus]|nr:hypothetical protein CB1_105675002 [Camelus ferus]
MARALSSGPCDGCGHGPGTRDQIKPGTRTGFAGAAQSNSKERRHHWDTDGLRRMPPAGPKSCALLGSAHAVLPRAAPFVPRWVQRRERQSPGPHLRVTRLDLMPADLQRSVEKTRQPHGQLTERRISVDVAQVHPGWLGTRGRQGPPRASPYLGPAPPRL